MKYILLFLFPVWFFSCKERKQTGTDRQREIENGRLNSAGTYSVPEIGWEVTIPEGWEVVSKKMTRENTEKGKKAIEKTMESHVDASGLKQLLNLRKDRFNSFLSTMEAFDAGEAGSYEEYNQNLYQVMKDTYAGQGMKVEYEEDSASIDGLLFDVFKSRIYNKEGTEVILNQVMYSRLLNGYDFGMTISYNSQAAHDEMDRMIHRSRFSIRK